MTKKNFHEIICPNCDSSFWINDAFAYFNNRQVCQNCKAEIKTGDAGLTEQVLIGIRRKASVRAIRMAQVAKNSNMRAAKKFVKRIARENHIAINTDVTPTLNFFLRIVFSGLLGLAVVGIGSIFFPSLQKVAAPVVCSGEFKIEVVEKLTTKTEGERSKGAVIVATCDDEDISQKTFWASVGIYAVGMFILLTIRKYIARTIK